MRSENLLAAFLSIVFISLIAVAGSLALRDTFTNKPLESESIKVYEIVHEGKTYLFFQVRTSYGLGLGAVEKGGTP